MKSMVKIAVACVMAIGTGFGSGFIGASYAYSHCKAEEQAMFERSLLPLNIDDFADGCDNPSFLFFTDGVIEEYEYDDVYCLKYADEEVENISECEVFVDSASYEEICQAIKTGKHTGGVIVPTSTTKEGVRIYTYKPSPTL